VLKPGPSVGSDARDRLANRADAYQENLHLRPRRVKVGEANVIVTSRTGTSIRARPMPASTPGELGS
jgi:hypothetical protein